MGIWADNQFAITTAPNEEVRQKSSYFALRRIMIKGEINVRRFYPNGLLRADSFMEFVVAKQRRSVIEPMTRAQQCSLKKKQARREGVTLLAVVFPSKWIKSASLTS